MATGAQDDVDVYRSMANMPAGGFYVGSTTGWLVNGTDPEFLRQASSAQQRMLPLGRADACRAAQVSHQRHAVCILLSLRQVSLL